jgi:hypothetical protein
MLLEGFVLETQQRKFNGARGWVFHPAFMALQANVYSRPPLLNFKTYKNRFDKTWY